MQGDPLPPGTYRDLQLLQEVARTPDATQRDLAKRIGIALGLTNLMLRRLALKGSIKIINTKKSRIRYLITPQGILEKTRLTVEFFQYSLHLYTKVRQLLRDQLSLLMASGLRRVVLCGTDELAEIACLTIQEMGLQLVAVVDENARSDHFLGFPVTKMEELDLSDYDRFVAVSLFRQTKVTQQLAERGVPVDRIICLSLYDGKKTAPSAHDSSLVPSKTDVVILCGGKGTRLGALTADTPKPLLSVGGYPFLLRLLLHLEQEGFHHFILAVHYLSDHFRAFLSTYKDVLPNVDLVVEPQPLGTGGALRHAMTREGSSTVLAINGDSWISQPLAPVLADHQRNGRAFTVVAVPAAHVEGGAFNKGVWRVGPNGDVVDFATLESVPDGWVNAGIYVLQKEFIFSWPEGPFSLEDNLNTLLKGKKTGVFCSTGKLLDIGTPKTYESAQRVLESSESLMPMVTEVGIHGE